MPVPLGPSGKFPRLGFLENMEMVRLAGNGDADDTHQFMSRQPAWQPGAQLPWEETDDIAKHKTAVYFTTRAYGGHVYVQAPLAAVKVVEGEDELAKVTPNNGRFGIHVSLLIIVERREILHVLTKTRQYRAYLQTQDMWTDHSSIRFRNLRLAVAFKPASSLLANQSSLLPIP